MGSRSRGRRNPDHLVEPLAQGEAPPFAIYVRKSTDESSNKQAASIPQQIENCIEYAEKEDLEIMQRNADWDIDKETIAEIQKDNPTNKQHREKLIKFYKDNLVITERDSALKPHKRKLWSELIKQVRAGKIRGLMGYAPDRFTRNLVEGGELIQLVDDDIVALKFRNFHFENNAAGQMMLGFWFVFAEHYSKKLSEDSTRGSRKTHIQGKAGGTRKFGYDVNNADFFIPNEPHFKLVQKAFKLKVKGWSDGKIADELNRAGWSQVLKGNEEKKKAGRKLTARIISDFGLWSDTFYYGVYTRLFNNEEVKVDLRNLDHPEYRFVPAISENEWWELQEKLSSTQMAMQKKRQSMRSKRLDPVRPLPESGFLRLKTQDGEIKPMSHMLPNPKRFEKKIRVSKESLENVVKPHQIRYRCQGTKFEILWNKLDELIGKQFKNIRVSKEDYQAYIYYLKVNLEEEHKKYKDELRRETILETESQTKLNDWLEETKYGAGLVGRTRTVWLRNRATREAKVETHADNKARLRAESRDYFTEETAFTETIRNLGKFWKKASYVQKRNLVEKIALNITITEALDLTVAIKPELESLFIRDGGRGRI